MGGQFAGMGVNITEISTCNETESVYIERLVDNWYKPNNNYPVDCSDPENCGSFDNGIEFTIYIEN